VVSVAEKKQIGTYVREDLVELVQAEDRPNTEIFNEALDMYFEAHGKGSAQQIEEELAEVREEQRQMKEEMLAQMSELEDREEELQEALEKKRDMKASREAVQRRILEDMAEHPAKNLLAYKNDINELLAHPDGGNTREEVLANLRVLASEYDVNISRLEENEIGDDSPIATDGDGSGQAEIDIERYEFDEDGDD
jgi:translation initiation factor 2B subunit (eIF-2B alpha/beta/delta family)